jgi:drug/metabolite transporter (DMT)-like permease
MDNQRPPTQIKKAIPLVLFAALFNTIMILLVKIAAQTTPIVIILFAIGVGVFGYLYQWCFTESTCCAPVRLTTPLLYASVIFSLLLDWWLWQIKPSLLSLSSIFLIICGAGLLVWLYPEKDYQIR